MTDLALRPRSSTEIIDLAVRVLRRHFGAMFTIALVGLLPGLAVQLLLLVFAGADPTGTLGARIGLAAPVNFVFGQLMFASLTAYADSVLRTGSADVREAFARGGGRLVPVMGVSVLSSLAAIAGFVLLFFPGVYVAVRLTTAVPAAVVEGAGVAESLRRAWSRGGGNVGHTFVTLLLAALVSLVVFLGVGVVAAIAGVVGGRSGAGGLTLTLVLTQVVSTLGTALVYPLFSTTVLLLAYDLRVRREAYDVEAMADALGAPR